MKKRLVLLVFILIAIISGLALLYSPPKARPNIVFVLIDCWRYDHFSPEVTPEAWKLSKQGVVFDNYYVNAGYTLASMAAIFSSQYPQFEPGLSGRLTFYMGMSRYSNEPPGFAKEGQELFPDDLLTWPEVLRGNGYATINVTPNGYAGRAAKYGPKQWTTMISLPWDSSAEAVTTEAIKQLRLNTSEPFLLYAHFLDMHLPYNQANIDIETLDLIKEYRKTAFVREWENEEAALAKRRESMPLVLREYARAGRSIDSELLRLIKEVDLNRTIVFITSDHGELFDLSEIDEICHEGLLPEEIVHVPLIILGEDIEPVRQEELAHSLDLFPTILKMAHIEPLSNIKGSDLFSSKHDLSETFAFSPAETSHITEKGVKRTLLKPDRSDQEISQDLRALGYLD